jgi:hypothetical protein
MWWRCTCIDGGRGKSGSAARLADGGQGMRTTTRIFVTLLTILLGWLPGQQGWAGSLESVLMPGKVNQGHATTEAQCNKCHVRFNRAGQDTLCGDCHKDVARDVAQKQGYHGRAVEDRACRECHTEHKGRDAKVVQLDERKFDHRQTDYLLKGKHAEAACSKCHRPGSKYRSAQASCVACHKKDDEHKGKLGPKCADCHTETNWKEAKFDHDKTRFRLEDKHSRAECKDCHKNNTFRNTPLACVSCHRTDDKHKGRFGAQCQTCHNAKVWSDVLFDHDRDTKYALRGRHLQAKCESCHTGNLYRDKLKDSCISCHRKDDKHRNTLGEKCADCHVERDWKEARFDHGKSRFPLRGKHEVIECKSCHKSAVFKETPMTCIACHKKADKHKGALGEMCADCHGERIWKETRFDHDKTRFALLGKHREVKCDSCHKDEKYKNTPAACLACHQKNDVHKGQQGEKCETCHTADNWKRSTFNHGRSRFPLVGSHLMVECRKCHATAQYKDAKSECVACHDKQDVHKRRLGTQCESCHNARSWRLWDFNHDTRTRFRLDGGHRGLDCYACHKVPVSGKAVLPTSCVSCHDKDDVHEGNFGPKCENCHETGSFKQIKSRLGGGLPAPTEAVFQSPCPAVMHRWCGNPILAPDQVASTGASR